MGAEVHTLLFWISSFYVCVSRIKAAKQCWDTLCSSVKKFMLWTVGIRSATIHLLTMLYVSWYRCCDMILCFIFIPVGMLRNNIFLYIRPRHKWFLGFQIFSRYVLWGWSRKRNKPYSQFYFCFVEPKSCEKKKFYTTVPCVNYGLRYF